MSKVAAALALCIVQGVAWADTGADRIVGVWLNEKGDGLIQIERQGDAYRGKIVGAPEGTRDDPDAKDVNNEDPALRDRRLLGLVMMGSYEFDGKRWAGGWIYDPDVGKRYKSRLTLKDQNTLEVRGYLGAPMFGRTQVWTRSRPARAR